MLYRIDELTLESLYQFFQQLDYLEENGEIANNKRVLILHSNYFKLEANLIDMALASKGFNKQIVNLDEIDLGVSNNRLFLQSIIGQFRPDLIFCLSDQSQIQKQLNSYSQKKLCQVVYIDKSNDVLFALACLFAIRKHFPELKRVRILSIGLPNERDYIYNFALLLSKYPNLELLYCYPEELTIDNNFVDELEAAPARTKFSYKFWNSLSRADVVFWENLKDKHLFETDIDDWNISSRHLSHLKKDAIILMPLEDDTVKDKRSLKADLFDYYMLAVLSVIA